MWQYTTETIINSNDGNLFLDGEVGKRFALVGGTSENAGKEVTDGPAEEDFFIIDGANSFKVKYITCVYKNPYRAEAKAKATITMPALGADKVYRLAVILQENGRVSSIMQNAYMRPSKPFRYEITATGDADTDIEALLKTIKKDMAKTDFHFFKAENKEGKLVLTATDCYIDFKEISLVEVEPLACDGCATIPSIKNVLSEDDVEISKADQGCGTVSHLIKDLRLPTSAAMNPFGADHGGYPVPGGHYDQYLIEYETPRHHVAGGVMGSVGDVSRTSHVFFVKNDGEVEDGVISEAAGASKDFEEYITLIKAPVIAGRSDGNLNVESAKLIKTDNIPGSVQ